jgi:hypothetical protein
MDIVPINNLPRMVEHPRHDAHEQPQKRQQPRKRERIPPGPVYSPNGELEEASAHKIDVLV